MSDVKASIAFQHQILEIHNILRMAFSTNTWCLLGLFDTFILKLPSV